MLSYPDKRKFQQIRARWEETAHPGGELTSPVMVGRKEKQTPPQLENNEPHLNGGSKFRRKLSHGLAFISHPLSQRKITPNRYAVSVSSLVTARSYANAITTVSDEYDDSLSLLRESPLIEQSIGALTHTTVFDDNARSTKNVDPDVTPKALPRSRTTSFIPRPVRTESELSTNTEGLVKAFSPAVTTDPTLRTLSSKIPTPSPPLAQRRISSPRQYLPQHVTYLNHTRGPSFVRKFDDSLSKTSVRSRTTPNLVKPAGSRQSPSYMAPRKTGSKRPAASPTSQKPVLRENVPTNRRVTQRRSQIQEKTLKRESLVVPGTISNRRSFGPGPSLSTIPSKQLDDATPLAAGKRLSSQHVPRTPLTAKRIQPNVQESLLASQSSSVSNSSLIVQSRLMGPKKASTPPAVDNTAALPSLPRSSTESNFQRKTLRTPNSSDGGWQTSHAPADQEVRSLPRSATFHNFGKGWGAPPPVPPIPDQYKAPSLFNPSLRTELDTITPRKNRIFRLFSFTSSICSIPEEMTGGDYGRVADSWSPEAPSEVLVNNSPHSSLSLLSTRFVGEGAAVSTNLHVVHTSTDVGLVPPMDNGNLFSSDPKGRRPSTDECDCLYSANIRTSPQVKDYMPTGYWAGRFSTLFDRWCTEAMAAQLNPKDQHQRQGPLDRCRYPEHEDQAKCYILAQLHDMCSTIQASESLWAFERKHRRDNNLLRQPFDLPPFTARKHDENSNKGAFGRAVRKLTPRKSSLVNLLKGKGWNKGDDNLSSDRFGQNMEASSVDP